MRLVWTEEWILPAGFIRYNVRPGIVNRPQRKCKIKSLELGYELFPNCL